MTSPIEVALAPAPGQAKPYSYDLVPYDSQPFAQSQPDQVAAMARLFGLSPVPPENARVLELGCASGGNIIALAARYPGMHIVGVELSKVEAEQGQATIAALALTNIQIRHADIVDVSKETAQYDYIIAHGVFSWVPEAVQDALLSLCGKQLSDDGVAYISYNVYPGWKMREVIREMMLFHAGGLSDPQTKLQQGRAILDYARKINSNDSAFGKLLAQEAELAMKANDYYLFHDHLEENNHPCYFKDFVARADQHGVAYLGEASLVDMAPQRFGGDIAQTLAMLSKGNIIATEQYMDFFTNRMFRQTLLVKQSQVGKITRNLSPGSVRALHFSSAMAREASADGAAVYKDAQGRMLTVRDPVMAAVADTLVLAQPMSASIDNMVATLRSRNLGAGQADAVLQEAVGTQMLTLMLQGMVRSYYSPLRPATIAAQPIAFGPARAAAQLPCKPGAVRIVPNTFHQNSGLNEVQAALLCSLDGSRSMAQIEALLLEKFVAGAFTASQDGKAITDPEILKGIMSNFCANALADFARLGLMQP